MVLRMCIVVLVSLSCFTLILGENPQNSTDPVLQPTDNSTCEDCDTPALTKGQKWVATEKNLKNVISYASRTLLRYMDLEVMSEISPGCFTSIMKIQAGLKKMKLWAFRFLDTMGKIPDSMLNGGFTAFGDFDGCLDINTTHDFTGQNCMIEVQPPWPNVTPLSGAVEDVPELRTEFASDTLLGSIDSQFKPYFDRFVLRIATCAPSTCTANDIKLMAEKVLETTNVAVGWTVRVTECHVKEKVKIEEWDDYTAIFLTSLLILMVTSGTLLDVMMVRSGEPNKPKKDLGILIRILTCFSIYHNTENLLKQNKSSDAIQIFNGMRVVSILWIVLSHTYAYIPTFLLHTSIMFRDIGNNLAIQPVLNGYPGVDTFFFIAGTLLMYSWLKSPQQEIPLFLYIFRRYWRLMPPVMFIIVFQLLVYRFGSGPVWEMNYQLMVTNCRQRWWTNMLFLNNFFGYDEACLGWSWYVAADMQLYLTSLLVLLTIKKRPKFSLCTLAVLSVASIAAIIINQYVYRAPPMHLANAPTVAELYDFFKYNYIRPHLHAIVYFTGLAVGYALHHKSRINISRTINIIGWCASLTAGALIVYIAYVFYNVVYDPPPFVSAMFVASSRLFWALSLSWVTLSCCTGNAGFITKLLSWSAFAPLAKLTYLTYLVHPIIMSAYYASTRTPMQTDHRTIVFLYLSFVMTSFMAAYFMSMLFEAPFMQLEKIMFAGQIAALKTPTAPVNPPEVDCERNDVVIEHDKVNNFSLNHKIVE